MPHRQRLFGLARARTLQRYHRNSRRDANDEYKQMQKDGLSEDEAKSAEERIQKLTDEYTEKIDGIVAGKEEDIMTI